MPLPAVRMGVAHKYLATVTGPWWREAGMTADGISDGLLGYTWNAGEGQEEGEFELICGFGGGPQAERLPAADAERRVALRSAVEMMLPGFEKARVGAPAGEALLVWRDDPWTRAGYSCPALGDVTTVGPQLRAGLAVGGAAKLVFAGEHCCPAFVGYMEGALQSGMVAAEQVMAEGMDETVARRAPRMQRVAT
jgi:monoamine oxidase